MAAKRTKKTTTPGDAIDLGGRPHLSRLRTQSTDDQSLDPQLDVLEDHHPRRRYRPRRRPHPSRLRTQSTDDQSLDPQLDVLRASNVDRVFVDVVSGAKADRPGLTALHAHVRLGDTVVVVKLDRLGRSLVDLLATLQRWTDGGVSFAAVEQGIDTSTAVGRMVCRCSALSPSSNAR